MKVANYELRTHQKHMDTVVESFEGTRAEARQRCREIDTDKSGQRKLGQTTHITFLKYKESESETENDV